MSVRRADNRIAFDRPLPDWGAVFSCWEMIVALLEERNVCSICGKPVHRVVDGIPVYYCVERFKTHNTAILMRELWVKVLMNEERQRRKRRNRLLKQGHTLTAIYVTGGRYG